MNNENNSVILMASSRANGNTASLANRVAEQTGAFVIDLNQYCIHPYRYEKQAQNHRPIDEFMPLIDVLLQYPKILFASPVYLYYWRKVMTWFQSAALKKCFQKHSNT
ncbi:hypothetical protein FE810_04515 [Thalassotalea litorea]|uniref:NADPH-dependent FMN reductase-like domain-containing protein n=1 Tax=Thalassotalea litorea TaxID=2020715 RepID=A0A5R9IUD0_9GAMM|nr:NAD(P)H-dependent oxidoreductase [Thalassotalea litorea]TLU66776.1 hypothetical protein FE810_04515 [Thalassotalea litorea]